MKVGIRWVLVITVCVVLPLCAVAATRTLVSRETLQSDRSVFVDPNVRVSFDGSDAIHMEAPIAASSTKPDQLYAAAQVHFPGHAFLDFEPHIYLSADGGAQWQPISPPIRTERSWDNAMAAGQDGDAYFVTHHSGGSGLTVYRTHDAGARWHSTRIGERWDREYISVDTTRSRYARRVYIAGEYFPGMPGDQTDGVAVISSSDGGATFGAPTQACARPGWSMATSPVPIILSDGALIVPCYPYPRDETERRNFHEGEIGAVVSTNGGRSFSPYIYIGRHLQGTLGENAEAAFLSNNILMSGGFAGAAFAVAPAGAIHQDRVYAVWSSLDKVGEPHVRQLLLAYSDDHGRTWTKPQPITAGLTAEGYKSWQANPMIAVNSEGVVGVAWFDDRNAHPDAGYDIYFSASPDSGHSFTPEIRVSTATSLISNSTTAFPAIDTTHVDPKRPYRLAVSSAYLLRTLGGDFSQMTVDAAGRFHPLWPDTRDGAWQIYTSAIHVITAQDIVRSQNASSGHGGLCSVDDSVTYVYGTPAWDRANKQAMIPVRLKNTSSAIILTPIQVLLTNTGHDANDPVDSNISITGSEAFDRIWPPVKIFDAGGRVAGDSATYTYPIDSAHPLFPNGVTEWVNWRFKVERVGQMFFTANLRAMSTARRCGTPARE